MLHLPTLQLLIFHNIAGILYALFVLYLFDKRCIKGLHLNMINARAGGTMTVLSLLLGRYLPFLVGFTREDVRRLYPYMQKNVYEILRESGYLHIQATKPDTAGILL